MYLFSLFGQFMSINSSYLQL